MLGSAGTPADTNLLCCGAATATCRVIVAPHCSACAEETFGGLKSAKMLLSDEAQQRRSLVGRFDWHVVQFLLALIPPGGESA